MPPKQRYADADAEDCTGTDREHDRADSISKGDKCVGVNTLVWPAADAMSTHRMQFLLARLALHCMTAIQGLGAKTEAELRLGRSATSNRQDNRLHAPCKSEECCY